MDPSASSRRFYKAASVTALDGGWGVMLDRYQLRTPARAVLCVPAQALAGMIAEEWAGQGETVLPATMPVTRLANLAQDRGAETADALASEIAAYAASDLVCYRTPAPVGLARRQAELWDPVLDWQEALAGVRFAVTDGLTRIDQPPEAIDAIAARARALDPWRLTAAAFVTGLTGSAVLGLMMEAGALSGDDALRAIRVEEDWNAAIWGRDEEEAAQAASRHADLVAADRYFRALELQGAAVASG
jgi:chaperone required for assembly of F1-ATPase